MLKYKSDYEIPDVSFLFGGYCWHEQRFMLWKISYLLQEERFIDQVILHRGGNLKKVVFIGDYADDARNRLRGILGKREPDDNDGLDLEPLEVIRDMLTDKSEPAKDYHLIGGAPQMLKVYRSLNYTPFIVKWKIQDIEQMTFLGNPIRDSEQFLIQ